MSTRRLIQITLLSLLWVVVAVLPTVEAAQRSGPPRSATGPTTAPASAQVRAERQRLRELSDRAIDLMQEGRLAEAEAALRDALSIAPRLSINLYNLACVKARQGHGEQAMDYLERAVAAGFTEFAFIEADPDLDSLRKLPRYQKLMAQKDDIQRREAQRVLDWLQRELGEGYVYEIDPDNRFIFATNTDRTTLEALRRRLVMQARSQWDMLFANRPDHYISIVLPSPADYRRIVPRRGVGGFYNRENRMLIAQRMGQIMQHEFTHALHNGDIEALNQEHPVWLAEGLAGMFESAQFVGEKLIPADNYRLATIQNAARNRRLIPLAQLLRMEQDAFVRRANFAYGQAYSLLLYLYEHGLLRTFYDSYKQDYAMDPTGRQTLERTTGMSLAELEQAWIGWMLQRTPPPLTTGPDGAWLGVRFGSANDGLRIDEVVVNGPAARAGILPGDLIVGLDDVDVRDQESLMPLLAERQPGERVVLRIRRVQEYLDVAVELGSRAAAPR